MSTIPTQNPVPSEAPSDLKYNSGKIDEFVTSMKNKYIDRFGQEHFTIEGLRWIAQQAISQFGYITLDSFQKGAEITLPNQVLRDEATGEYYRWDGKLPKVVPVDSTPDSSGGIGAGKWLGVGDASLRHDLSVNGGVNLVNGAAKITGDDFTGHISAKGVSSLSKYGQVVVGDHPFGNVGNDWPSPTSKRDAVTISRKISNNLTDCHAVSDKTIIDTPSDAGTYGAVDVTTILRGSHTQDHLAAFQDRIKYEGDGVLDQSWGMIMWPSSTGRGTIKNRTGLMIRGVNTTTSVVNNNIAIDIDPRICTDANVGVLVKNGKSTNSRAISYSSLQDTSGYSFNSSKLGVFYQSGVAGFGIDPFNIQSPSALNIKGYDSEVVLSIGTDNANGGFISSRGNSRVTILSNGNIVGVFHESSANNAFSPGVDGSQPLGLSNRRWSTIYSSTGAISTSDKRLKEEIRSISNTEKRVSHKLRDLICIYKLKSDKTNKQHVGVIAQDVIAAFLSEGLDANDYGIISYDNDVYGVRYDELSMFMISTII
ncbi:tail fiber domain-containing protein [Proteus vulgaris]|uniref:Peptidase S74 domain-containing protein n=1 Tax=Proteus vulgaris TaxID=585 RepID=A0A6G6SH12_PROVU|nr:tail fiber domain-containing protein [Proteus vulgaris]QIF94008.1 hypothetical protein GTH24_08925 [Proteus vulgaris]